MRRLRSFTWRLALAVLPAHGCDLADDLKGEPCDVDDDCWHTQHCARTMAEKQVGLPGVCMPKDVACVAGEQLGCSCNPDDSALTCAFPAVPSAIEYPTMTCDPTQLVCVVENTDTSSEG